MELYSVFQTLAQIAGLVIGKTGMVKDDEVMISHQPRLCIRDGDQVLVVIYLMGLFGQMWGLIFTF